MKCFFEATKKKKEKSFFFYTLLSPSVKRIQNKKLAIQETNTKIELSHFKVLVNELYDIKLKILISERKYHIALWNQSPILSWHLSTLFEGKISNFNFLKTRSFNYWSFVMLYHCWYQNYQSQAHCSKSKTIHAQKNEPLVHASDKQYQKPKIVF